MPETTPLATAYSPDESGVPQQMSASVQQGYPMVPGRGDMMVPDREGGVGVGPQQMQQMQQQQMQQQMPFPQMTPDQLKAPINIGADGMTMSIDEMSAQKQQQRQHQAMMQQQAYLRNQQMQQMQQRAAQEAMERKMAAIAKDELKQQALGYIAMGVCIVLGAAVFMRPSAL